MQDIRGAFTWMVRAARKIKKVSDGLKQAGIGDDPLFDAYGDIVEALDKLIGPEFGSGEIETSVAYQSVNRFNVEDGVDMLMAEYEKHNPVQPKPHTFETTPAEAERTARSQGGYARRTQYVAETPEGDWT